jgi:hypothetical protein
MTTAPEISTAEDPRTTREHAAIQRRAYQRAALEYYARSADRFWGMLWERQSGKSTTIADMCLFTMLRAPHRTCIYGSASLLLATELPLKISQRVEDLVEKDSTALRAFAAQAATQAAQAGLKFDAADSASGKSALDADSFQELFAAQRLEFRVYHSRTAWSRTKIIAPNVATARSWTGSVFLDEIAFIRDLRALITAVLPIISTQRDFKLIVATTPPEYDDTHYSYELLAPAAGSVFGPNPAGNWYVSESGVRVHRVDARDSFAAGKKFFDLKTGDEITPEEALARAPNKDGFRIAHFLVWTTGGAAACDLAHLNTAQERGIGQCGFFKIENEAQMSRALDWLRAHISPDAPVGLGLDKATTTGEKSNPSALAVVEQHGPEIVVRAIFVWRERDPEIADDRIERVIRAVASRPGGRARALAIDATNERYDAERQKKLFRRHLPVLLIVASEAVKKPGLEKPTNWKEYLGEQYCAKLNDNRVTLPPDEYVRLDHRLVLRDRGRFVCEPDDEGRHGDTFDAVKLALHALNSGAGGPVIAAPVGSAQKFLVHT